MSFNPLPEHIWSYIYLFDPTYHIIYLNCLNSIKHSWSIISIDQFSYLRTIYQTNLSLKEAEYIVDILKYSGCFESFIIKRNQIK